MSISGDLLGIVTYITGVPFSFSADGFGLTAASAVLGAGIGLAQNYTFTPTAITVAMTPEWGGTPQVGVLGSTLSFTEPVGWTGATTLTAVYGLRGTLATQTRLSGNVDLSGNTAALGNFVTIVDQGSNALVNFDPTGHSGGTTIAVLQGSGATVTGLAALIAQGAIRMTCAPGRLRLKIVRP